jgi:hypothetical protein
MGGVDPFPFLRIVTAGILLARLADLTGSGGLEVSSTRGTGSKVTFRRPDETEVDLGRGGSGGLGSAK